MTIKELNNLKESINNINEFNKTCLQHEYERRHDYKNEMTAIEEYGSVVNMSFQSLTLKCQILSGIDMSAYFKAVIMNKQDLYNLSKLDYLTATRLMDCYYNHFYKVFRLILNTL